MSLRFAAVSGYARLTGAAALGNSTSGTLLGLYRKEDSTADRDIFGLTRSGGGAVVRIGAAGQIKGGYTQNASAFGTYNVSTNTYVGLALTLTDSAVQIYAYDGSAVTLVVTDSTFFSATNLTTIYVGDQGPWGDGAIGCYRYLRYWPRILTSAQILDELEMVPDSGTPAADTTNLRGSWLLPDATTTTDLSGIGNTLTISGGSTSSDEPSIGGGGGSVLPLPQRPPNMFMRM